MNEKVVIKRVREKDLNAFFELFSRLIRAGFPEYSQKTREFMVTNKRMWTKSHFKEQVKRRLIIGAWAGNKIVGLIYADSPWGGVSLAYWLMIDPNFQRQGIGKKLLATWEKIVKDKGAHFIYLYADKRNVDYYKERGFEIAGLMKKGWFGSDDYIFTKLLQEPKEENYLK